MGGAKSRTVSTTHLDSLTISDSRRLLLKIILFLRRDFRFLFGLSIANESGFFVDMHLSRIIHGFADWVEYPKGNHALKGHQNAVWDAAISSDGHRLFTASSDHSIMVWNLVRNELIHRWISHTHKVTCLSIHRSESLVSGSADKTLRLWNALDYKLLRCFEGHTRRPLSVRFNQAGTLIVSCSTESRILIWSLRNGECITEYLGHSEYVPRAVFIGGYVMSVSWDTSLRVWDPHNGTEMRSESIIGDCPLFDLNCNCDGSMIAVIHSDGLSLFKYPELLKVDNRGLTWARLCRFHPIIPEVIAAYDRRLDSVQLYDILTGEIICSLDGHSATIRFLCFSPDGSRLITCDKNNSVLVWDLSPWINN